MYELLNVVITMNGTWTHNTQIGRATLINKQQRYCTMVEKYTTTHTITQCNPQIEKH